MTLSRRALNRTLLRRQHLLARVDADPLAMAEHLLGLQAQEPLPPYLSLAARLEAFDPHDLSRALETRAAVRVLLMRGTLHLVTPADAFGLRRLVQPMLDKVARTSAASRPAAGVDRDALLAAGRDVLADGPLGLPELGRRLGERFPDVPPAALASRLREATPLVQVPPRGLWGRGGGVVHEHLDTWLGGELTPYDGVEVARRYLRAFGPALPADLATWSGATGARPMLEALGDELVRHRDEDGRVLYDLEGLTLADPDEPAPVRLLGRYDNLWLSHAARDRVTPDPALRQRWTGSNGGVGATVFVDGVLAGLWRRTETGRVDVELFARLGRADRADLDVEVGRIETLLALP